MKKSKGSPSRTHGRYADAPLRQEPVETGTGARRWKAWVTAGIAVVILILLILPCQRRCGGPGGHGPYAYRQVLTAIPSGTVEKISRDAKMERLHAAGKKRPAPRKRTAQLDRAVLADKKTPGEKKKKPEDSGAKEKNAIITPDRQDRSGKTDPAEQDAARPVDRQDRDGDRGTAVKPEEKRYEKPKTYDFGTKIELVPAPQKR